MVARGYEPSQEAGQQRDGFVQIAQGAAPGRQNIPGYPPPPNPPFVPDWLLPRPITIPLPNPFKEGDVRYESAPGFITDQNYWEINPSTGEQPKRYKPFEPNKNPDRNGNGIPDNVEPDNPTGSYLFPALISALRKGAIRA